MAARIVAILVALGMIGGAIAIRSGGLGGDGGHGDGGGSSTPRLVCATELEAACQALASQEDVEVTIEAAGDTAERLSGVDGGGDADIDGWLTPGPWPEMVDEARRAGGRPPLFEAIDEPIARSPLLLIVRSGAAGAGQECLEGGVEWKCIGDAAAAGFRLSGPRTEEATAILAYGALAGSYLGTTDYGTNDLTGAAMQWLDALKRRITTTRSGQATSLPRFIVTPAVAEGFLTTEAEWAKAAFGAANVSSFGAFVPAPAATADLHLGVRLDSDAGRRLAELFEGDPALELVRQQGWRVPGRDPIAGVVPDLELPEDGNGLPSAGVLQGLREVVE